MRMLMLWLALGIVLIWASFSEAACSGTSPSRFAASASQTDVMDCVTAASSGDTIMVPPGTATWSTTTALPRTKDLTITGAGIGSTVITCGASTCFTIPNSHTFVISGFEFTGNSAFILHRVDAPVVGKYHRVHHNKFRKAEGGYSSIDIYGEPAVNCNETTPRHPSVLYDHNTFMDVRLFVAGTACSWADGTAQHRIWNQTPPQGSWPEILYIEDNTFISTGGYINMIDVNYAGRYVLRYNTITTSSSSVTGAYAEIHGVQGNNRASQWKEIYGNTHSAGVENFFGLAFLRSGSGVLFGNRVGSSAQVMRLNNERSHTAPGGAPQCSGSSNWDGNQISNGWPCRDQIGRMKDNSLWTNNGEPYSQDLMPFYFWNNYRGTGTEQYVPQLHPDNGSLTNYIMQNRDWYTENTSFNGASGVGSGPAASRPSTCTTGVAYWATDEGEWNSMQAGKDGQLYKCTATNTWTLYYKPFTYPHPLQTGGGTNPTPSAPQNLQVK